MHALADARVFPEVLRQERAHLAERGRRVRKGQRVLDRVLRVLLERRARQLAFMHSSGPDTETRHMRQLGVEPWKGEREEEGG